MPEETDGMLGGYKTRTGKVPSGTTVEMISQPHDAPTMFIEGINGLSITPNVTKIHCIEQFAIDQKMLGRHVVTLVIPNDQLVKISKLLSDVVEKFPNIRNDEA